MPSRRPRWAPARDRYRAPPAPAPLPPGVSLHGALARAQDWGHWVSRDFVKWARLPVSIWNDKWYDSVAIFSGSTTIVDGKPVIVCKTQHPKTQNAHNQRHSKLRAETIVWGCGRPGSVQQGHGRQRRLPDPLHCAIQPPSSNQLTRPSNHPTNPN